MAELTAESSTVRSTVRGSFFVWMSCVLALLAFAGFTPTYFLPMADDSLRQLRGAVHLHGMLFFGWTLLLIAQTLLVANGSIARHRAMGLAGISLATAMVIFGLMVNLLFNAGQLADNPAGAYQGAFNGQSSMVLFGMLFGFAIANIRKPEVHKRLMIMATIAIMGAAITRLYSPLFGTAQEVPQILSKGTQDLLILAVLIYDWRLLGRPHKATLIAGGAIIGVQILRVTVTDTAAWQAICNFTFQLVT